MCKPFVYSIRGEFPLAVHYGGIERIFGLFRFILGRRPRELMLWVQYRVEPEKPLMGTDRHSLGFALGVSPPALLAFWLVHFDSENRRSGLV